MRETLCSSTSSQIDEPLAGTASQVRRWLLVEDPGPWGYDAIAHNHVPAPLFDQLRAWARSVAARVVLIRRGPTRVPGARRIFLVDSTPTTRWISEMTSDDLDAVLAVDNAAFAAGNDIPGERRTALYLVCTHGRHDRCCSIEGNPVSRRMCSRFPDESWECSHIGGDRFAANVVYLPRGAYFGRLSPEGAVKVTEDYAAGTLDLEHFRGWSSWPFAVQAAEIAARKEFDLVGVDDVVPEDWTKLGESKLLVRLSTKKFGPMDVTIGLTKSPEDFFLTCRAAVAGRPTWYETISIDV